MTQSDSPASSASDTSSSTGSGPRGVAYAFETPSSFSITPSANPTCVSDADLERALRHARGRIVAADALAAAPAELAAARGIARELEQLRGQLAHVARREQHAAAGRSSSSGNAPCRGWTTGTPLASASSR